ncbi:Cysteine-rich secretory protein family protein [Glycomyces sambucus]|uniref:Cysteine-rich secretory protein family protein n=1 Tax=Glycomyces sambucus TaxID=380244 RepID=A0A1G9KIP2_9ACTN|nr:CAP domain-containing protein [Glycomyces sambucus]SDL49367.1 Cysteine-rich secretory protein family protein [Glycomyces sambucus]
MRRLQGGRHRDPAESTRRMFIAILASFGLAAGATSLWAVGSPLDGTGVAADGPTNGTASSQVAEESPTVSPQADLQEAEILPQDAEEEPTTEAAEETTTAAEDEDEGDSGGGGGDDGGDDAPYADAESEILGIVNDRRAENGCGGLDRDSRLDTAARLHAEDMAVNDYFDHTSQDGRSPTDRANAQGYEGGVGENIAYGYPDAEAVMEGWMNSEGHRANILNCDYDVIGIGAYDRDGTIYWVQMFG